MMRKRIFKYYFVLIFIILLVSMVFSTKIAQKYYKDEVENKLQSIALSLEYFLLENKNQSELDYDRLAEDYVNKQNADNASTDQRLRITFVDFSGKVLGDSGADIKEMENHLERKEIQEALQKNIGNDIRFSETVGSNFLYIATSVEPLQVIIRVSVPFIQLNKINDMILYYSLLTFLGALLLSVLISLSFTDSITKSLKDLICASKEIANGNYAKRIKTKSRDELGQLALNFNEMAAKLETTITDLHNKKIEVESIIDSMKNGLVAVDKEMNIILINPAAHAFFAIRNRTDNITGNKITQHIRNNQINMFLEETIASNKALESDLSFDNKIFHIHTSPIRHKDSKQFNYGGILLIQDMTKVRKLEQLRTEFVSNVTHELKTPITSIRGFVETLKNGAIRNEKVAGRFLDIIDIEAERLHALIEDILQLSEIENRQKDTDLEECDIKGIVDEVYAILQPLAEEKNIQLHDQIEKELIIDANKNRIKQMILNLVDNGIKYNKPNGSVEITAYKEKGKIVITITDTGVGIPAEHCPRIFERFYRADKGRNRDMGGTGLGLSIVKHIVNLYNGDIKVESEVNQGTAFIIQIPCC